MKLGDSYGEDVKGLGAPKEIGTPQENQKSQLTLTPGSPSETEPPTEEHTEVGTKLMLSTPGHICSRHAA